MPNVNISKTVYGEQTLQTRSVKRPGFPDTESYVISKPVRRDETRTRTGVVTSNYWRLVESGEMVHATGMEFRRTIRNNTKGMTQVATLGTPSGGYQISTYTGDLGSIYPTNTATTDTSTLEVLMRQQTITKLLLELKDSKVNMAQAFAEREQTIQLIGSTAVRLARAFGALQRGNIVGAAKALGSNVSRKGKRRFKDAYVQSPSRAAASGWLELQYGWKPLLSDIYGLAEQAAQVKVMEVKSQAKATKFRGQETSAIVDSNGVGSMKFLITRNVRVWTKMSCTFAVSDPEAHSAAQLGLSNPALLAWELMPYSFVVDWFLPVGNFLASLDATRGLRFLDGTYTVVRRHLVKTESAGFPPSTSYRYRWASFYGDYSVLSISRSRLTSFPSPIVPQFKNPMSVTHALNAISLLKTRFGR